MDTNAPANTITTELIAVEPDLEYRQAAVRRDEWNLYLKGLKVVDAAFDRLLQNPPAETTFTQVARLAEVVNRMGRVNSGLGFDGVEQRVPDNADFMLQVDAILDRVFGTTPDKTKELPEPAPAPVETTLGHSQHESDLAS